MKKRVHKRGYLTNKELVVDLLKKNPEGLTITDIASKLEISRNTVAIILAELKGAEKIRMRNVGMAKLHYWKGRK